MATNLLSGISVSPGFAIAPAFVWREVHIHISAEKSLDKDFSLKEFEQALPEVRNQLEKLIQKTTNEVGPEEAQIFESQMMFTDDPEILSEIKSAITLEGWSALWATEKVFENYAQMMADLSDPYLRERALDLRDLKKRIQKVISGKTTNSEGHLVQQDRHIVVAKDLSPSDFASMEKNLISGLIIEANQRTSHTVILAKTYGIPTLVAVPDACAIITTGDVLGLNAQRAQIFINPDDSSKKELQILLEKELIEKAELQSFRKVPVVNSYQEPLKLEANITSAHDLPLSKDNGAEGVGLFRTEFLFLERAHAPTEHEQYEIYRKVLEFNKDWPIIIRTLDIGGDKQIPYLNLPKEENPFLGVRGLRLCLKYPEIFLPQLRALLRASIHGQLRIMFPMVTNVSEMTAVKELLAKTEAELVAKGTKVGKYEIGMMVETPASTVMIPEFAPHIQFVSIGTNDLTQYVLAVDRMNDSLASMYDPFNPAVLKLIQQVIRDCRSNGIRVGICGELAGDTKGAAWLAKQGAHELSMNPNSLLKIRRHLSQN